MASITSPIALLDEVEALLHPRDLRDPRADAAPLTKNTPVVRAAMRSCPGHRDALRAVGVEQLVGRLGVGDDVGQLVDGATR